MRRLYRHLLAIIVCITIFSLTGTLDGLSTILQNPGNDPRFSLAANWLLNVIIIVLLCVVVLTPVVSIADYLFTYKWPLKPFVQLSVLLPMLAVYLIPWSFFFGRFFFVILVAGSISLALPILLYWVIFKGTDLDFGG